MQKIKSTRSPTELVVQICGPDFCHYVSSQCKFLLSYCKACQVSTNTFLPFTFCLPCFLRSLLHFCINQTTHKQALQISLFIFSFSSDLRFQNTHFLVQQQQQQEKPIWDGDLRPSVGTIFVLSSFLFSIVILMFC